MTKANKGKTLHPIEGLKTLEKNIIINHIKCCSVIIERQRSDFRPIEDGIDFRK